MGQRVWVMKYGVERLGRMGEEATLWCLAVAVEHFSFKGLSIQDAGSQESLPGRALSPSHPTPVSPHSHTQGKHAARQNLIFCKLWCFCGSVSKCSLVLGNHGNSAGEAHCLSCKAVAMAGPVGPWLPSDAC